MLRSDFPNEVEFYLSQCFPAWFLKIPELEVRVPRSRTFRNCWLQRLNRLLHCVRRDSLCGFSVLFGDSYKVPLRKEYSVVGVARAYSSFCSFMEFPGAGLVEQSLGSVE